MQGPRATPIEQATVNDVESWAYRVLELAVMTPIALLVLITTPVLVGSGAITLGYIGGTDLAAGGAYFGFALSFLFFVFVVPFLAIALLGAGALIIGITVYVDAKTLETADIDWQPDPALSGLTTFFFPPVAFYYLYKRHEHVADWVDTGRWGAVAAGSLVLSTPLIGAGLVIEITTYGTPIAVLLAGLGIILLTPFPYAIYRDSTYVCLNSSTWHPNPGLILSAACASMLLLPPTYLLFGGYYLYRRRQALRAA